MKSSMTMSLSDYQFAPEDQLLLDANVWLLVHGPRPVADRRVDSYADAYKRILEAKSRVHIDVLLVSEIIRGIVRIRCRLAKCGNLKEFVSSSNYPPVAQEAVDVVRRILRCCLRIDDCFASMPVDRLIDEFGKGRSGFNDHVLSHLCRRECLTLVTDDGDFRGTNIPILTANATLLE